MDTKIVARSVRMQEWAAIIQDRVNSGMTIKKYCEVNNIRRNAYFYWLKQLRETAIGPGAGEEFVEVHLPEAVNEKQEHPVQFSPLLTIQTGNITVGVNNETPMGLFSDVMGLINAQ